ncbi:Aste57867_17588 [Aphanomyces stellatus]|uniref:Aste57867_17588 protein n=1 Tax=Aphanomyces stellatus TaxID=120398 RepID=A0A485L8S8_9STRA|nr:hypothetical protein As57867_017528 [Aphanomyces stellatus]VFT94339.1 Aste57867_17588 [Aphanomyces stellatus]
MLESPGIAIDVGTTTSCIAVYRAPLGVVELLANEQGHRTTPSVLAYVSPRTVLVGDAARAQRPYLPPHTVLYDTARLLGRTFDDPLVQRELAQAQWPFSVVPHASSSLRYAVAVADDAPPLLVTPEEATSVLLRHLKRLAASTAPVVANVVLTVPASFNATQRQALRAAAALADLSVRRLVNAPTAAALAYDLRVPHALVVSVGGGHMDVTLLDMAGDDVVVRATCGLANVGGRDIDRRVAAHLAQDARCHFGPAFNAASARVQQRLEAAAEDAKRTLSTAPVAFIELDELWRGRPFCAVLTRATLDELCNDLYALLVHEVARVLATATVDTTAVDALVLAGGVTRDPTLRATLATFFDGRLPRVYDSIDEAAAVGAACVAAAAAIAPDKANKGPRARDGGIAFGLDVETDDGGRWTVLPPHTLVPMGRELAVENASTLRLVEGRGGARRVLGTAHVTSHVPFAPGAVDVVIHVDGRGRVAVVAKDPRVHVVLETTKRGLARRHEDDIGSTQDETTTEGGEPDEEDDK